MADIDIFIEPDGSILLPRGSKDQNDLVRALASILTLEQKQELESFLSMTDDVELLFGKNTFCG